MFYERLNLLCKLHGTTVTEVATTKLGVASSAATNWKHGASPRCDIVVRAAEHFGVSADYLLGLSDTPAAASPTPTEAEVLQVINLLSGASDSARSAALAAMRAVIAAIDSPQD
ncbi:MAG: helix-turn-helix transcriptional regulator [Clostridia bacterium]|nr:helix-turn-helix transcriptional regulator [Clostridia bacterium]